MSSYRSLLHDSLQKYSVWELARLCVRVYWTKLRTHLSSTDFLVAVCGRARTGHSAYEQKERMWSFGRTRGRTSGTVIGRDTPKISNDDSTIYPGKMWFVDHPSEILSPSPSNPFQNQVLLATSRVSVGALVPYLSQTNSKSILAQQALENQLLSQLHSQSGQRLKSTEEPNGSFASRYLTSNHTAYHYL
jgi:hypothetical protein